MGGRTVLLVTSKAEWKKWALWLAVGVPVVAAIVYMLVWYGPDLIARHDVGKVSGPLRMLRLQQARDAARGRLLTLGAGLFAAGALIFTAQNYRLAQRTLELTEQGQVTDRYTKAIQQLGSSKLDVRIGGIYALERVARDSPRDHPTVIEVLAAFIREHSRERWPVSVAGDDAQQPAPFIRPDVQAALTVIGRRDISNDRQRIDLTNAVLPSALLFDAHLVWVRLVDATLKNAVLTRANLGHALLNDTDLAGANLAGAHLNDAMLIRANLTGADLTGADLTGAQWSENAPAPQGWERDLTGRLRRTSTGADNPGNR